MARLVSPDAKSSLMFAPEAEQVVRFCDGETHDRYAPTKQNLICNRRSVMEIIAQHPDFINVYVFFENLSFYSFLAYLNFYIY